MINPKNFIRVSIPNRGLWFLRRRKPRYSRTLGYGGFQSLIGVYGFCGADWAPILPVRMKFQSLIGVYGFCGKTIPTNIKNISFVSIPNRGLWFLRRGTRKRIYPVIVVSIPSRGLWFLRLQWYSQCSKWYRVSIPSRGLWFLRLDCHCFVFTIVTLLCFNP